MSGPLPDYQEITQMGQLMTKQMREDIEEQSGGIAEQLRRQAFQDQQKKSLADARRRLAKSVKIRNANRKKNKAARKARRKQR